MRNRNMLGRRPRLGVELLEDRRVPASIAGVMWKDSLGGGTLNGGEVAFGGINLTLYLDNGNGIFEPSTDTIVNTGTTDPFGAYLFAGLDAGRYFVDYDETSTLLLGLQRVIGNDPLDITVTINQDVTDANIAFRRQSPPPLTVPSGFEAPGAFPIRASGAQFNVRPQVGSTLGGSGSDNILVTVPASGPYQWTESRHNEGDISGSINPAQPGNPDSFPPNTFVNFAPTSGLPTYAWRISKETGLSFASVHANGFDNQDITSGGGPVGTVYGTAYFNTDSSGGFGYNPTDGTHRNGGNSQDLQMGIVGTPDEASFNVAMANFPFDEGWVGGYVDDLLGSSNEALFDQGFGTPGLSPSAVVTWADGVTGLATVNLTSFRSDFNPTNGMLFVSPNSSDNNSNLAAALPGANGWTVAIREDNDLDLTGQTLAQFTDSEFQFMYMDFRYDGLVGARINGTTGATIRGAGNYTLTRLGTGEYALTIPGKTDASGTLLLTVNGSTGGANPLPDRNFLSYQFDAVNNRFVIQARELTTGGNPFGEASPLSDTDFSFAFIDYTNPVKPAIPPKVESVVVNAGQTNTTQRSKVTSVTVTFDSQVTFAGTVEAAFGLSRIGGGAVGSFTATANVVNGKTVVVLSGFNGAETQFGSLADGRYTVLIRANQVTAGGAQLDGDGNGTGGDDFTLAGTTANGLFRLFGDVNGDGTTNAADFGQFRPAFGSSTGQPAYLAFLDIDGDGTINAFDFGQFRNRFGASVP